MEIYVVLHGQNMVDCEPIAAFENKQDAIDYITSQTKNLNFTWHSYEQCISDNKYYSINKVELK